MSMTKGYSHTGAFGKTDITFTPVCKRKLEVDVRNCPHCGVGHASLDVEMVADRFIVRCPSLGGAPIVMTVRLFLHPI
jgi:hypothetical protein